MKLSQFKSPENQPLPTKLPFRRLDAREAIHMLRFLLSPKGRKILQVMSDEYQTVGDIQIKTRLEQSEVSVALRKFRQFDLVLVESLGKFHYYKLDFNRLTHILEVSGKLAAFYDPDSEDPEEMGTMGVDEVTGSLEMQGEEI